MNVKIIIALLYTLFLFSFAKYNTNFNLNKYNNKGQWKLANFSAKVYHHYCEHCRATLLIQDQNDVSSNLFLRVLSKSVFDMSILSVSISENYEVIPWKIQGEYIQEYFELTIIFWSQRFYNKVHEFLKIIEQIPYWNRYSKIIINAKDEVPANYTEWVKNVSQNLWKRKILRVFICFYLNKKVKVFMYNPFSGDWAIDITHSTDKDFNAYLDYELEDLFGYPMKTYLHDVDSYEDRVLPGEDYEHGRLNFVGKDGKFLTEIPNILNCTVEIYRESENKYLQKFYGYVDKSYFTRKNFINYYDFDIWFTAVKARSFQDTDYVFLHERDDLCFVIPSGKPVPQYLYIFMIIPYDMWIISNILLLIVAALLWYLKRPEALLDSYRMFINAPLKDPAQFYSQPERFVLCGWIIFSFIGSAVFQSILTNNLIKHKFYPDLNTIDELLKSNLTIYSGESDFIYFQDTRPIQRLENKILVTHDWTVERMVQEPDGDTGFMVRYEVARTFMDVMNRRSGGGRAEFHIMDEHPMPSAQAYMMPRGHPYYEEMIWMINKIHESGLYYLWRETYFGWNDRNNITTYNKEMFHFRNNNIKLSFHHLQSAFYILFFGQGIALVALIAENVYFKYSK